MKSTPPPNEVQRLIPCLGPMAELVRRHDWSETPFGPIEQWSRALLAMANVVLGSPLPSVIHCGPDMRMLYNDAYRPLLAEKHPWALGRSAREVWQEAWPRIGPQFEAVLATGEATLEQDALVPILVNGELEDRYWVYTFSPVYEDGRIIAIFNACQDVTPGIIAAQKLRESEERATRILQSIGDAVIVTDVETRVVRMNSVAEELTGWPVEQARGELLRDVFRIVNERTRETVESPADKVRRLGTVVGLANHTILIGKDGAETFIDDSGAPIRGDQDEITGIVLVFRDVTERRELERAREKAMRVADEALRVARDSEARMQLALIATAQGTWTYTEENGLVRADPTVQELFAMPERAGAAAHWLSLIHEEDRARVTAAFAEARTAPKPYDVEFRIERAGGTRWIRARATRLSEPGELAVLAGLCEDVTMKHRAEEALRQTEKLSAVGRLAASIAHEINNPLESVTNLLYLARASADFDEVQGYLDTAERELRRVSAISNQTLRFHKQSSSPAAVTCEDLIDGVLSIYQGRVVNSRIEVEKRRRASRPVLCFDGEIRQVLNNLVGNAIDAMHPLGGRLLLRSREATQWRTGRRGLVITVADSGEGMSPAVLKQIFEPFYTTKGIGGTGLGLWVSEEIVARHHGALRVRSRQHAGTVFTMFLPFDAVPR